MILGGPLGLVGSLARRSGVLGMAARLLVPVAALLEPWVTGNFSTRSSCRGLIGYRTRKRHRAASRRGSGRVAVRAASDISGVVHEEDRHGVTTPGSRR